MLDHKNLRYNFFFLRWIFRLPWHPLKLEHKTNKLKLKPENHQSHKLWSLYKILLIGHLLFIVGRALELKLTRAGKQQQEQLPFALTFCLFHCTAVYGSFTLFSGSRRYLNIKLFNQLFSHSSPIKGEESGESRKRKSFLLFVIRYLPFFLYSFCSFYPLVYTFHPEFSTLIISVVDPQYRNLFTSGVCLCLEMMIQLQFLFICQYCGVAIITFITHFMEKTQEQKFQIQEFQELVGFEARFHSPFAVYTSLYELNLLLSLFNLCFSDIFFLTKLVCLGGSISSGFSAIRLIRRKPTLGLMSLIRMNNCVTVAKGIFDNAYKITMGIEELKQECRLCSAKLVFKIKRRENRMLLRAIPRMEIQIGGFYKVEREATPIFVDYVCSQISSLLITFH